MNIAFKHKIFNLYLRENFNIEDILYEFGGNQTQIIYILPH